MTQECCLWKSTYLSMVASVGEVPALPVALHSVVPQVEPLSLQVVCLCVVAASPHPCHSPVHAGLCGRGACSACGSTLCAPTGEAPVTTGCVPACGGWVLPPCWNPSPDGSMFVMNLITLLAAGG